MTATVVLIPSRSTAGTEYPVHLVDSHATGCPCKARTYRPTLSCRHMRAAETQAASARRLDIARATLDAAIAVATGRDAQDFRKARRVLDRPTITLADLAGRDRFWDPLSYIDAA